ncbi:hypothetical protein AAHA92_19580 [Salvia divinorum]|uniref:Zinc finger PHD-type domain-containing protein n=1 Tax=Salvia divinorum TaxID=28513 RepID=A0ABD1H706_SALDI
MSEKEKEIEMVDHWSHEHPLTLVETRRGDECYGCKVLFSSGEQGYGCRGITGCQYPNVLHEECVAMSRTIRHPLHPQHTLVQLGGRVVPFCKFCKWRILGIGYGCTSSGCKFDMHLRCARGSGAVMDVAGGGGEQRRAMIRHPSHPNHELKLWRRRCSFTCDACGTTREGSSYTCTEEGCQYWIHESCASLPLTVEREDHDHSLSVSFHVPPEYIKYDYKCDVCTKLLQPENWIYHCRLCRYIAHVKCAFSKPPLTTENEASASNWRDIVHLPTNEAAKELITPFVMRQEGGRGRTLIPPIIISHTDDEMVNAKYKFIHHQHELNLVSSSPHDDQGQEEEDEENYGKRSGLICDGCITPISSSSSSTTSYYSLRPPFIVPL